MNKIDKNNYFYKEIVCNKNKIIRYFSFEELSALQFIDSLFFLKEYFKEENKFNLSDGEIKIYSLNNLQIIFNRILKRFLQSRFDKYWIVFIKKELNKYLIFRNIFLNNKYSLNPKLIFEYKDSFSLMIDLYQDLNNLKGQVSSHLDLKNKSIEIKHRFEYNNFKNLGWQYKTIHFLQKQINKKLHKFIDCFLIHGSFATKDFLENWSDLDVVIILNNKIFQNVNNLKYVKMKIQKLSLLCQKIDPLAHHLFSFLTKFDLNYYPSYLFPSTLYDYSLLLNGQTKININLRSDKYDKIQIMNNFVNYFRNKVLNQQYSKNHACWKNDVAHLMLWPSFMLQSKNIYISKKYSFKRAKKEFPQIDFGIIDQATQIMKDWSRSNILKYYPDSLFVFLPFKFNQVIINRYKRYLNNKSPQQTSKEIETFTKNALLFLEKTFNSILKDLKNEN